MQKYKNLNNDSEVEAYDIDEDYVLIKFKNNVRYLYNEHHTGKENLEILKKLAKEGKGLNHFINEHLAKKHAKVFNKKKLKN